MKLYSQWGEKLDIEKPLQEYPRPNLVRESYINLNGLWQFQIVPKGVNHNEDWHDIVVPFAVGSNLSLVPRVLKPNEDLWYKKTFKYEKTKDKTILHFEAVDQVCWVFLNGSFIGKHEGGYNPFSFDVSEIIEANNELIVKVADYSEQGIFSYGKQRLNNKEIWYKATAGIWQSVWLEDVNKGYIKELFITPLYDEGKVLFSLVGDFEQAIISISENGNLITRAITNERSFEYTFDSFRSWSTEDPFLYDVFVETEDDIIKSYFGMRKISQGKDSKGHTRFYLNNEPVFLTGILDQGYISDGYYTYPSDSAMIFDLTLIKELGFNMVRKHVKQENRRWYYHCDTMGLLVFQDMMNGGKPAELMSLQHVLGMYDFNINDNKYHKFGRVKEESRNMYYKELNDMILTLYNNTSVVCWVSFNEGWGQFDSNAVYKFIKKIDSTRLVDSTSGWFDQGLSDFNSKHIYFRKFKLSKDKHKRISFLSEFGGYSYLEKDNFMGDKPYGYKKFKDKTKLEDAIIELYKTDVLNNIDKGLSGCVYTQLSDVENEYNGLITFDRKVLKINPKRLKALNLKLQKGIKYE